MDSMSWIRAEMASMDIARTLASFAANWLLQSTFLIAVGLAAGRLLRSRGAAIQSAIFRTTLAASLACPVATSLLAKCGMSGWSLEMPPAWTYQESPVEVADDAATEPAPQASVDGAAPIAAEAAPGEAIGEGLAYGREPSRGSFSNGAADGTMASSVAPAGARTPVSPTVLQPPTSWRATMAVFHVRAFGQVAIGIALLWLTVSTVMFVRLLRAWRRLNQLRCAAAPAELAAQGACRELAALLNVSAPELLRSPYLVSPCLAGLRRPAVLLPETDPSLPIHDVLIHELAHLRRRDGHWNLLRRLAEAAFFYQPLLWLLTRRLEAVAEEVCDDYVVHFGGNREQYARGLVEIAELSAIPLGAASVAMVSLRSILARRITRIMDSSRALSTRVGNLLLAAVIAAGLAGVMLAGFVGLGSQRSLAKAQASADGAASTDGDAANGEEDKATVAEPKEKPAADEQQANEQPGEAKPASENQLEGIVTGANGKPIAGAKFYWFRARVHDIDPQPPRLLATTDKDGRYRFVEPAPVPAETPASWEYMDRIVISASGHGFKYTSSGELRPETNEPQGIVPALARALPGRRQGATSLPSAGDPIRGRLVDINGQPVAGAKVRIRWFADEKDQLGGLEEAKARGVQDPVWQTRVSNLLNVIEPVSLRDVLPSAVTDAEGRFELRDLGARRLVQLLVEGDAIEATEIVARNEAGEQIVLEFDRHEPGRKLTVHPSEFLHAVGPSKPVTGRVLDLDSGEPIAGAVVRAFQVHGERLSSSREREQFAVRTDAEGRYRITGLPIGKENELVAFATGDAAYIPIGRDADTSAPGAEVELDFRLKRGVWAEGRVYDAETRKPFAGELSYYFFRDRKQEEAIPGLKEAFVDGLYWTNADGEFRVPVLPTRGILAFRYDGFDREGDGIDRFARGFGADKIAGSEDLGGAKTYPTAPFYLMPGNYERIAEVPATDGQETVRVDMPLFASPPVTVRVVDADGQPATRFQTYGANERWGWQRLDGPQFEILDLQPGERRKVFVFHRAGNLAGGAVVEYGAKDVVEIKLVKAGSVRGRLLDADGEPIDDATLQAKYKELHSGDDSAIWAPHPDLSAMPTNIPVDKQGRFRLDGLIPGWSYHAHASAPRVLDGQTVSFIIGTPFSEVRIEAGEEKDLGDLTVDGDKRKPNQTEAKDSKRSQEKPSKGGTAQKPIDSAAADLAKTTTVETAGAERRHLHGRVVDEAGRPIAGAQVRLLRIDTERTTWVDQGHFIAVGKSGADGTFAIDFPSGKPFATREEFISSSNVILADAENHVFDWRHVSPGEPEITLQLSAEDLPIEGRVVDLEGRPIAGIHVGVNEISGGAENLDQWVEQAKRNPASLDESMMARPISSRNPEQQPAVARYPGNKNLQPGLAALLPRATTDENGSFRLAGLGRDRLVRLELSGAGIAKTWLNVVTREMPAVPYPNQDPRFRVQTCFGRRFKFAAEPEQPITGVVRDAESGRPLVGAEVRLNQYADSLLFVEGFLAAKTDEQGRYALHGVPKPHDRERSHRLRVVPGADQPYFRTEFRVAKRDGFEPVQGDVKLKRALWLRGRVIDTATGQPIHGLVEYYPFRSNQAAADYANFNPGLHLMEGDRYATDEDGNYQIPVLPGRGLVAFIALQGDRYPAGDGVDKIADLRQQGGRDLNVYHLGSLDLATALREVNPPSGAAEAVCDIELKSLPVARVKLVDEQGRPVAGAVARRLAPHRIGRTQEGWSNGPLLDATVVIFGPRDQARTLMFLHRERKLAGALLITPRSDPPETIVLRPAATLSGRIVDRDNKPIADLAITVSALPPPGAQPLPGWVRGSLYYTHQLENASTDKDGAFRIEQVPPGVAYVIYARHGAEETTTPVVEPGEKLDLSDVVLQEPKEAKTAQAKAPAKPEPAAIPPAGEAKAAETKAPESSPKDAGSVTTLRGRVLDPEGTPASGAALYWPHFKRQPPQSPDDLEYTQRAATDAEGRFEVSVSSGDFPAHAAKMPLFAYKPGYGLAWIEAPRGKALQDVVLRLVEDRPIRGRVTDTEGRPVAKACISVNGVMASSGGKLDEFLTAWKQSWNLAFGKLDQTLYAPLGSLVGAVTDAEGRFELAGVGIARVARVEIAAPGFASAVLHVVNREGFDPAEYNEAAQASGRPQMRPAGMIPRLAGPEFDHIAEAELTIRGKVFVGADRAPVGGAAVSASPSWGLSVWAPTDAAGRYELRGLPRNQELLVSFRPPEAANLLHRTLAVSAAPGQAAVDFDAELKRGVIVEGRVFDRATGDGVKSGVRFVPLAGNSFVDQPGYDGYKRSRVMEETDLEGRFRLMIIPGPGVLMAQAHGGGPQVGGQEIVPYRQASFTEEERKRVAPTEDGDDRYFTSVYGSLEFLTNENAVKVIDAPPDGGELKVDLPLDPGKLVKIAIQDDHGQPLSGAFVAGFTDRGSNACRIAEPNCTIYALGADRPRRVCLLHPERRLAASLTLTGEESQGATVRLAAAASITGRAIDDGGALLTDAVVQLNYVYANARELERFASLGRDMLKTAGDGRFQMENVVPGERFVLDFKQGDAYYRATLGEDQRQLTPGQQLELGDLKLKRLR